MIKKILLLCAALLLLWVVISFVRMRIYAARGGEIIQATTRFERKGTNDQKILVLGDSLAYGTGTSAPEKSVAGLVASVYPEATVENRSANGKRTNELAREVATLEGKYDLILIIIGGNDNMRPWIDIEQSGKNLETIYAAASAHADKVIAFTTGNMRTTTFFPWPLNLIAGSRSVTLRNHAIAAAEKLPNVRYMDMVAHNEKVPFTHAKESADHLHLNDEGAAEWFNVMRETKAL